MRFAAILATALLAAALALGCGSSDDDGTSSETPATETAPPARDGYGGREAPPASSPEGPAGAAARICETLAEDAERLRATAVPCAEARRVMLAWQRAESCGLIGNASRGSCVVRSYRCLSVRTGRGVSVSCARPGRSIAFLAQRG